MYDGNRQPGRRGDTGTMSRYRRGELQGVITVEMSYILPMILFVVVLIVHTVFYFHDKNILIGAAAETAVLGAQMERKADEKGQTDLSGFCRQRLAGKLILFGEPDIAVEIGDRQVTVSAVAENGRMALNVRQQAPILRPEKKIRLKEVVADGKTDSGGTGSSIE